MWRGIHSLMIQVCPHCGYQLQHILKDGLTNCVHCNQVFDSSDLNQLLSAAWHIRRQNWSLEQLKWHLKMDDALAILVYTFVADHGYTHEEFLKLLKKLGVAHKSYIKYDNE